MKLAFVFPGQGSQTVGMMQPLADNAAARAVFATASAALGQDLWQLVAEGPDTELARTVNTQPVMLTADLAVYEAWLAAGGRKPDWVAGHSLGEYAALVAAGSMQLTDAAPAVRFRAQAMQAAVPEGVGAMAAILGLSDADTVAACLEAAQGEIVEAVNFNAPSQVVIAGHKAAVERAIVVAKAKGAKRGLLLPVSAPFHSSLLKPAALQLADYLSKMPIQTGSIRLTHNADLSDAASPDAIRAALSAQAASAVRWVETIQKMAANGVTHLVECGPGKVLTGMCKRIAPEVVCLSISDPTSIATALETLA
jgi:[acyl-carrier-protein] S-malonyltransferase